LKKHPQSFAQILKDPDKYEIQILYTQIDRRKSKPTLFRTHRYGVNDFKYFHPGETIELPAALLALEKLNQHQLDKYMPVFISKKAQVASSIYRDSTAQDGYASIGHYIKKMLIASDHDAFNQIFEFVGSVDFNDMLQKKGYTSTSMHRRLPTSKNYPDEEDYEIAFVSQQDTVYKQANKDLTANSVPEKSQIVKGVGLLHDSLTRDIKNQNRFALQDAHKILKAIFFPEALPEGERFHIKEDDYQFLYQYMSQLPVETSFPASYAEDMDDGTMKYFLFGGRNTRLPRHIRSFNKVGKEYGYLMDHAYIVDFEKGIEFLLSAVIYCNPISSFDDTYEYESVGKPFMENLGKAIFEYELSRKRSSRPDLSRYEVNYDK
jgi:hypothetical protein